jgi:hypothetical protein
MTSSNESALKFKRMKSRFAPLTSLMLILATLALQNCGSDPAAPIESDNVKQLLLNASTSPWTMQSVIVDGTDQTPFYNGLKIYFNNSTFTAINGGAVWPVAGSWGFTDTSGRAIERSDGLVVTIDTIESNKLILSLTWSTITYGPGRTSSIIGKHIFTFSK